MKYKKENGDYLELEIYQVINGTEHEETLTSSNYLSEAKQIVTNFLTNIIYIKIDISIKTLYNKSTKKHTILKRW